MYRERWGCRRTLFSSSPLFFFFSCSKCRDLENKFHCRRRRREVFVCGRGRRSKAIAEKWTVTKSREKHLAILKQKEKRRSKRRQKGPPTVVSDIISLIKDCIASNPDSLYFRLLLLSRRRLRGGVMLSPPPAVCIFRRGFNGKNPFWMRERSLQEIKIIN